jgi:hypothetical protein
MKRSASTKQERDIKKAEVLPVQVRHKSIQDDSSAFDKLESLHYESQSIQSQLEGVLSKMKENINDQVYFLKS